MPTGGFHNELENSKHIEASNCPLHRLYEKLGTILEKIEESEYIVIEALDPDFAADRYNGESISIDDREFIARNWQFWTTLASVFKCRMLTPLKVRDDLVVHIRFQKLSSDSFHDMPYEDAKEKYGSGSIYESIHKNEEPAFHHYFTQALENLDIYNRDKILDLGSNRGDEFASIRHKVGEKRFSEMKLVGIDHCKSAIAKARKRYSDARNVKFIVHDINDLDGVDTGRYDLIISIATLHSPGVEMKPLLMNLLKIHLEPDGAFLFAFPNSRWVSGELLYGAKAPNYRYSELSLLFKEIYWIKKYLQQHRFRVTITGREYIFVTATKIRRKK